MIYLNRKAITMVIILIISFLIIPISRTEEGKSLGIIIIWHYHQPYYRDPMRENFLLMPWVRMHSAKNYYRMAEIVSLYPDIHVTFDFSGSLMQQIEDYVGHNATDLRENLSKVPIKNLTLKDKIILLSIPGGMFDINWARIVTKVPRYSELLEKRQKAFKLFNDLPELERSEKITAYFTNQDYVDLIALFNLHWLDPEYVKRSPELNPLLEKGYKCEAYTQADINLILWHQRKLLGEIFPIYKKLLEKKQIEVIPTPYAHPILPLLADFGWNEDVRLQIQEGIKLFKKYFGIIPKGMWSPEAAVNEESVLNMAIQGIMWTVADKTTLMKAGIDTNDKLNLYRPYKVEKDDKKIVIFFRDSDLSNRISFTYQSWDTEKAIADVEKYLLNVQKLNKGGEMVLTIALDGENPWEGYPNNGNDFLHALYKKLEGLQKQGKIRTLTPSEYLKIYEPISMKVSEQKVLDLKDKDISLITDYKDLPFIKKLQILPEGSWAGDLATWIGEKQENVAWMWIAKVREIFNNVKDKLSIEQLEKAQDLLLIAETSCWWFWYGTDMDSGFDHGFTRLHQLTLYKLYQILGEKPPGYLLGNYFPDGTPFLSIIPERQATDIVSIKLDGSLDEKEWGNAAKLITPDAKFIEYFYIGYDNLNLYVGIKPKVDLSQYYSKELLFEIILYKYCTSPWKTNTLTKMQKENFKLEMEIFPFTKGYLQIPISSEIFVSFENIKKERATMNVFKAKGDETYELEKVLGTLSVKSNGIEIQIPIKELDVGGGNSIFLSILVWYNNKLIDIVPREYAAFKLKLPIYQPVRETLFEILDPHDDDYGPGTYVYPKADVFKEGIFDITKFTIRANDEVLEFEFQFKNLGGNPWNGPYGFCLQVIQVYMDTAPGGRTDPIFTEAPRIRIDDEHPWDFAFQAGPGWELSNLLMYKNGTIVTNELSIEADQTRNIIIILVPKKLLVNLIAENYVWHVVAIAGSWDGYGIKGWRMIGAKAEEWIGGGAPVEAILADVQPLVYDVVLPEEIDQKKILSGYDVKAKKFATIPAITISKVTLPSEESRISLFTFIVSSMIILVTLIGIFIFLVRKRKIKQLVNKKFSNLIRLKVFINSGGIKYVF
jgi:alpha-amylase/alpha-mannosidase (GH57 family)